MSGFSHFQDFMEATIDWLLTNQQIPKPLPGTALWRHIASQKWRCTRVELIWRHTTSTMAASMYSVVLGEWYQNAHNIKTLLHR